MFPHHPERMNGTCMDTLHCVAATVHVAQRHSSSPTHSALTTHPTFGAKGLEDFEVVLTLIATSGFDAAVIVDVVLPTIFRLVLIREPRIKLWGLEDYLGRL